MARLGRGFPNNQRPRPAALAAPVVAPLPHQFVASTVPVQQGANL